MRSPRHSIRSFAVPLILTLGWLSVGFGLADAAPIEADQETALWGEALVAKVDSLAEVALQNGPVAALSIGVRKGNETLLARGYGLADIENEVPAKAETVFRIGSITKQFTAAAIMQLVEAGDVSLDDEITKFFPDYPTQGHTVTVRHLLTHTSGIKSYTGLPAFRTKRMLSLTDEELVDLFKDLPFDFAPGERYLYNNSAFYLLGMIVEEVSGHTYRDYVRTQFFEPLGLSGSMYCDERPLIPWRAEGYARAGEDLVNDDYLSMNLPGAAGALCSTVPDLLAWTEALTTGRVVSPESYRMMTTSGMLNDGSETGYGFGLAVGEFEGHRRVAHGGGINGFVTMLAHYPDADLDIVVLANTEGANPGRIADTIARWALGVEVAPVLDLPLTEEEMGVYEGVYELREGFEIRVFPHEGQLFTQATGQQQVRIKAQGEHTFIPTFDDEVRLVFEVDEGKATSMTLFQAGQVIEAQRIG